MDEHISKPELWEIETGPRYVRIIHKDDSMAFGQSVIATLDDAKQPKTMTRARLIAAAPKIVRQRDELLAICQRLIDAEEGIDDLFDVAVAARAAVAKVTDAS